LLLTFKERAEETIIGTQLKVWTHFVRILGAFAKWKGVMHALSGSSLLKKRNHNKKIFEIFFKKKKKKRIPEVWPQRPSSCGFMMRHSLFIFSFFFSPKVEYLCDEVIFCWSYKILRFIFVVVKHNGAINRNFFWEKSVIILLISKRI
jgi:hypothetical protein